jgi:hypothetical protein
MFKSINNAKSTKYTTNKQRYLIWSKVFIVQIHSILPFASVQHTVQDTVETRLILKVLLKLFFHFAVFNVVDALGLHSVVYVIKQHSGVAETAVRCYTSRISE